MKCSKGVFGAGQACQAMGSLYHDACFTCAACSKCGGGRGRAMGAENGGGGGTSIVQTLAPGLCGPSAGTVPSRAGLHAPSTGPVPGGGSQSPRGALGGPFEGGAQGVPIVHCRRQFSPHGGGCSETPVWRQPPQHSASGFALKAAGCVRTPHVWRCPAARPWASLSSSGTCGVTEAPLGGPGLCPAPPTSHRPGGDRSGQTLTCWPGLSKSGIVLIPPSLPKIGCGGCCWGMSP